MKLSLNALKNLKESIFRSATLRESLKNQRRIDPNKSETPTPESNAAISNVSMDSEHSMEPIVTRDAVVHFAYDVENPPPRPTSETDAANGYTGIPSWTRFVCISDTHCNTFKVPDGDVLLHAGDLTHSGRLNQMKPTIDWIKGQPHPHKIVIAGNHDLTLDHDWYLENGDGWHRTLENPPDIRKLMDPKEGDTTFHYLQYESTEITHGNTRWKAYGSPGSPWFGGWAFNYNRETEAEGIVNGIPEDVDILLTHGPPHRTLDLTKSGIHAGCEALKPRVETIRPAIHIFGHIHEARGAIVQEWPDSDQTDTTLTGNDDETMEGNIRPRKQRRSTVFVNAAVQPSFRYQSILSSGSGGYHYPAIIVDIRNQY